METRAEGAFAGTLGLLCRDTLPVPHIGFALLPEHRGKGYVSEAGRAVLDHARDVLGLPQLCAIVSPDNADSIRALEKLGLQRQGLRVLSQEDHPVLYYTIALAPTDMDSRAGLRHPGGDSHR